MKYFKKINILVSFFIFFSCYESLDVNQLDDYVYRPVVTSALTYFKFSPIQFFDSSGTIQEDSITDESEFKGFEYNFLRDNVVKLEFNAEIKNEFDRDVTVQVEFLNENNVLIYRFRAMVVEEGNLNYTSLEEIVIASNPNILNTANVRVIVELENTGVQMNPADTSEFEFKSSVTLYIES